MASDSLSHRLLTPLAGVFSDDEDEEEAGFSAAVSFPSFWPPFPSLLSDSDSDAPFPPLGGRVDGCPAPPREDASSAFFGLGFHDEEDEEWAPPDDDEEVALPLCWDCLQLEDHDHQRWDPGLSDGDEWEQVIAREEGEEEAAAAAVRSLEWEVLLAANSLGGFVLDDDDDGDDGGIATYFVDEGDDVLFGQFAAEAEHESPPAKGGRPAAKAAVEGLPVVVVAETDAARGDAQCAVCKDGIEAGEGARRLPCAHLYHDACILPWLAIRNTCPLCRHELPTDDPEYEKWKAGRAGGGGGGGNSDANGELATETAFKKCRNTW